MNLSRSIFVAALLLASPTFAGDSHDHKPLHGGVVAEVKDIDMELVAKPDVVQLHVRQGNKAVDVSKASARVTLLVGTEKQDIDLKPAGDRLEAKGNFKTGAGAKAVAVVNLPGKPAATVRFALK